MYILYQHAIYSTVSPTARIHESQNQGVEIGVAPLTTTSIDPPVKFFL